MEQTCSQNQVHKIRKNKAREHGFLDLTNYIEDEMTLFSEPLFSIEAVGQYEDKPLKPQIKENTELCYQGGIMKREKRNLKVPNM